MFDQNWSFLHKKWRFWTNISKHRLENSKCGKVKPRSDISIIFSGQIANVLVTELQVNDSLLTGQASIKTNSVQSCVRIVSCTCIYRVPKIWGLQMAPANIFGTHNYLVRERSVFDIFSTVVSSTFLSSQETIVWQYQKYSKVC